MLIDVLYNNAIGKTSHGWKVRYNKINYKVSQESNQINLFQKAHAMNYKNDNYADSIYFYKR